MEDFPVKQESSSVPYLDEHSFSSCETDLKEAKLQFNNLDRFSAGKDMSLNPNDDGEKARCNERLFSHVSPSRLVISGENGKDQAYLFPTRTVNGELAFVLKCSPQGSPLIPQHVRSIDGDVEITIPREANRPFHYYAPSNKCLQSQIGNNVKIDSTNFRDVSMTVWRPWWKNRTFDKYRIVQYY